MDYFTLDDAHNYMWSSLWYNTHKICVYYVFSLSFAKSRKNYITSSCELYVFQNSLCKHLTGCMYSNFSLIVIIIQIVIAFIVDVVVAVVKRSLRFGFSFFCLFFVLHLSVLMIFIQCRICLLSLNVRNLRENIIGSYFCHNALYNMKKIFYFNDIHPLICCVLTNHNDEVLC